MKWEYMSVMNANLQKMNELGEQGWEHIGIYPMAGSPLEPNTIHMMFLFKRPKQEAASSPQFLAETYRT
jgi:hypothetical protein